MKKLYASFLLFVPLASSKQVAAADLDVLFGNLTTLANELQKLAAMPGKLAPAMPSLPLPPSGPDVPPSIIPPQQKSLIPPQFVPRPYHITKVAQIHNIYNQILQLPKQKQTTPAIHLLAGIAVFVKSGQYDPKTKERLKTLIEKIMEINPSDSVMQEIKRDILDTIK
jgi:hypothetical protein